MTLLRTHHIIPSMSRPANPYDHASCESFMKTLKREEIYANTYRDLDHLRANIAAFIEQYDNRDRLHRRWAITHRKRSSRRPVRRPLRPEPPCGFSGLERMLKRRHQPGIRLKQQKGCEEQHALNHQVCFFQTVSTKGFTPLCCANFVL